MRISGTDIYIPQNDTGILNIKTDKTYDNVEMRFSFEESPFSVGGDEPIFMNEDGNFLNIDGGIRFNLSQNEITLNSILEGDFFLEVKEEGTETFNERVSFVKVVSRYDLGRVDIFDIKNSVIHKITKSTFEIKIIFQKKIIELIKPQGYFKITPEITGFNTGEYEYEIIGIEDEKQTTLVSKSLFKIEETARSAAGMTEIAILTAINEL